eukprot:1346554-Amorphochlora_amoeboformis.AAC.2
MASTLRCPAGCGIEFKSKKGNVYKHLFHSCKYYWGVFEVVFLRSFRVNHVVTLADFALPSERQSSAISAGLITRICARVYHELIDMIGARSYNIFLVKSQS